MKKIFPGCRVRILYSYNWPELAGKEGWVRRAGVIGPQSKHSPGKPGWYVAPDIWGTECAPCGKYKFCALEDQLEVIIPEGMTPAKWEDCLWQPEKEKVTA